MRHIDKRVTGIEKISLSNNNIKALPDEIGACTTLEELYVNNNAKFNYFPSSAGHLRRLKELALSKCPALKQFPQTGNDFHIRNTLFRFDVFFNSHRNGILEGA